MLMESNSYSKYRELDGWPIIPCRKHVVKYKSKKRDYYVPSSYRYPRGLSKHCRPVKESTQILARKPHPTWKNEPHSLTSRVASLLASLQMIASRTRPIKKPIESLHVEKLGWSQCNVPLSQRNEYFEVPIPCC